MEGNHTYLTAGFTLIELLIAVAIIGILAAISVPLYKEHTTRAYNAAAVSDLRYLKVVLEAEFASKHAYPIL